MKCFRTTETIYNENDLKVKYKGLYERHGPCDRIVFAEAET